MSARDLPDEITRASELTARVMAQFLAPPPRIDTAQWAAQYRHIAKGPERGPWRNERTPYLVEPMQCASGAGNFPSAGSGGNNSVLRCLPGTS